MCLYKSVTKEIVQHITWQFVILFRSIPLFGCLILLTFDFAPLKERQRITRL